MISIAYKQWMSQGFHLEQNFKKEDERNLRSPSFCASTYRVCRCYVESVAGISSFQNHIHFGCVYFLAIGIYASKHCAHSLTDNKIFMIISVGQPHCDILIIDRIQQYFLYQKGNNFATVNVVSQNKRRYIPSFSPTFFSHIFIAHVHVECFHMIKELLVSGFNCNSLHQPDADFSRLEY